MWKTLQGWKDNFFSVGGKEILIKIIAQAIPTYVMSSFRLPKLLCDDLHKCMEKQKIRWKRWDYLCLPKKLGGAKF